MSKPSDYQDPHCPECARLRGQVAALSDALGELMDQVADMPADPEDCYAAWGACRAALSETASTAQALEQRIREEERERAARIAEEWTTADLKRLRGTDLNVYEGIAAAIRARNGTPETPGKES